MISGTFLALSALLLATIYYFVFSKHRNGTGRNYPPGPTPWPLVGNIPLINSLAYHEFDAFTKLAKIYGPIFSVKYATQRAVVLNDYKVIREAFNELALSGRPDSKVFNFHAGGKNGVLSSDGQIWSEQRRFTLRHLRDFGFGKNNMEFLIMDEVSELIESFKKQEGQPIQPRALFSLAILNALWIIVTGTRFAHDDPTLNTILREFFKQIDSISSNLMLFFVPMITTLAPEWSGWSAVVRANDATTKLYAQAIAEHNRSRVQGSPRDFIDTYLDEIDKTTDPDSSFYKESGHKQLVAVIGDLFAAGAETTSTTLNWAVFYLAKFPAVQKKFQEEIDQVVGNTRLPSLADKPMMPYTEALMYEILRKSSIVPLGLDHCTTADTKFHGYDMPRDTFVLANLYEAHHNEETWGDPHNFRPERFLVEDKNGKLIAQRHEALIPFSIGKRQCLGETLARDEFFLYMTSIFQRFSIELDEGSKELTLEPMKTFLLSPQPYSVIMTDRF